MPIYEYRCKKCGGVIEKIQKFSARPLTKHEGCGGKLEPVLSSPAIQFKGSGFYITDYARKSSAPAGESSGSSSSGGDSKSNDGGSKSGDSGSKSSDSGSKSAASESKKSPATTSKKD